MATLAQIDILSKQFSDARRMLADKVTNLQDEIEAVKRRHMPFIKRAIDTAAEKKAALHAATEESADLFVKPRTVTFYGIKVGFQKGKGKIEWEDDAQVIRLIKKYFPDQADVLIKTTEKPILKALNQLTVAELKKIGVTAEETGDQVVIRSTDSEIDKLVNALLKGSEEIEEAA